MYTGKLVKLRAYRKEEIPHVYELINDYEVTKGLLIGSPFPLTLEDELKWFDKQTAFTKNEYNFAIEKISDGVYIGGCGINEIDWKNKYCFIGIWIAEQFFNQGLGSDAFRVLVNFCFQELGLHKVQLGVFSFNKRAIRSYEKVGFKVEAVLRETIYRAGEYHDNIYMGITADEWHAIGVKE